MCVCVCINVKATKVKTRVQQQQQQQQPSGISYSLIDVGNQIQINRLTHTHTLMRGTKAMMPLPIENAV